MMSVAAFLLILFNAVLGDHFDINVFFTVSQRNSTSFKWKWNEPLSEKGCDTSGKLAFIAHGWRESLSSPWVKDTISNLSTFRGGCVIVIDYSFYGNNANYVSLRTNFDAISNVLTKRLVALENEGFDPDNWFMFGHSAGARLVIDAAVNFGHKKIKEIDACELAGPGFDYLGRSKQPQQAAKNIACIHTSSLAGSNLKMCHQDWMIGNCGKDQPAQNFVKYLWCQATGQCDSSLYESHGLCPHFYNSAFRNNFFADNSIYNCIPARVPTKIPRDFKMGYMETRKSSDIYGDFFAPTAINMPWNVVNGVINN